MGRFEGTWASRPQHPANLVSHLEPLEACLGVEELPFDAQGPASIPGVGGVIKSPTQPDHVLNIVHSYEMKFALIGPFLVWSIQCCQNLI
jgi:hypothetical protein